MKSLVVAFCITLVTSVASAQTFDLGSSLLYEPVVGSSFLHNARAMGMGGAVTASAQDGSALWYNPAALARIPRIELSGDIMHNRVTGASERLSLAALAPPPSVDPTEENLRRTRLGSAYITVPVPTYRGALTLAGGVAVSHSLDRALAGAFAFSPGTFIDTLRDDSVLITEEIGAYGFNDNQRGSVRAWQAGFGIDISPRVSIGVAGVYYDGDLEFTNRTGFNAIRNERYGSVDDTFPIRWDFVTSTTENISGWGAHGGVLFRPQNNVAFGAVVRTPVRFTIDADQYETVQQDSGGISESQYFTTRNLQIPFTFTMGGAVAVRNLLFAGDFAYTDWSQTEYNETPVLTQYNDQLSRTYREQFALGGGVEWVIPSASTTLRAGVRWAKQPYNDSLVVDDRLTVSGGVGFLLDQVMTLDLAVAHEAYRGGNPVFGFDEDYSYTRVVLTTSYRL
jgi:long-subunit fatty acid transport protein